MTNETRANILIGLAATFLLFGCCGGCGYVKYHGFYGDYSEGERTGIVYKFSRKGVMWKSWEGQLKLSDFGLRPQGSSEPFTNVLEFSIVDEDTARKAEEPLASGRPVRLRYRQWLVSPIMQDTQYTVEAVEPIEK
jgi:hypothetical protein